ncbi:MULTISPECIES: hypothetical protein [Bifidobacterium]|nr:MULTISPECIES: hypothetical protein [Bifidobacterium]
MKEKGRAMEWFRTKHDELAGTTRTNFAAHGLEPGREAYHLGSIYYATAEQMEAICPAGIDLDRYATLANGNVGYDEADAHWDDAAWWDEQERATWHGGHGSLTGNGVRHRCRAHPEDFLLAGRLTTRQLPRSETGGFDAFS